MTRRLSLALLLLGSLSPFAFAQPTPDLRFKWQPNQTQRYKVSQETIVQETTIDEKTMKPVTATTKNTLILLRVWTVRGVDAAGVATLEMSIKELRTEITQPDGTTISRDSAQPDHRKDLAEFLDKPIVVVRVDAFGKLVEVKEIKQGSATRLQAELPFRFSLPERGPTAGQTWTRDFPIKLDPPHGTGTSYDFAQKFTCKSINQGMATLGIETTWKAAPKTTEEQVPLVPMLWRGEVYFNTVAGKYHAARLTASTTLNDHLGEGSKFVYSSTYSEDSADPATNP